MVESRGCQEMNVDPTETASRKLMFRHKSQDLFMLRLPRLRKISQQCQHFSPALEMTEGDLTRHEGMSNDLGLDQQLRQLVVPPAQVIHPNGCIGEDHGVDRRRARRRGTRRRPLSEPPRAASLRALSRAIRASRPAWTIAVFSLSPVKTRALATSSSSRINVVLICISMPY